MARDIRVVQSVATAINSTFDTGAYQWVTFKCMGLGAAETVDIKVSDGASNWMVFRDLEGNAITFTGSGGSPANRNQLTVDGGQIFQFSSLAPAGTVTITAVQGPGINS